MAALSEDLQPARATADPARAPMHAQAVVDALARLGHEARQRQSMSAVFLDEVRVECVLARAARARVSLRSITTHRARVSL